jgi:hypothetical protein
LGFLRWLLLFSWPWHFGSNLARIRTNCSTALAKKEPFFGRPGKGMDEQLRQKPAIRVTEPRLEVALAFAFKPKTR